MIIDMHAHVVPEHFPPAGSRASAARWPFMDHFEPGRAKVMIDGENFRTVTDQCWNPTRPEHPVPANRAWLPVEAMLPAPRIASSASRFSWRLVSYPGLWACS
jgi:aminocarboxymuconate-semialdehyde decarboxylase